MIYYIKQAAGAFAKPLTLVFFVAVVAAIFRFRGKRRVARWMTIAAIAVAYLGTNGLVADALLGPLEQRYSPLGDHESLPAVEYVVVLGTGYMPRDGLPVTAALSKAGLVRIVEGVRLLRHLDSAILVVSGGAPEGEVPSAKGYAKLAGELGVPYASMVVLDSPLDTAAEALAIVELLGDAPFVLVTSAYHMPRAMQLMERAGGRPVAAPTGHEVNPSANRSWRSLLPSSTGLRKTEQALHEHLGLASLALGID